MAIRDTRSAILEAAIALMARAGADGISASQLAAEAGISKATLFHHFRTIDEIPVAALDLLTAEVFDLSLRSDVGLRDVLVAIGSASFEILEERRGFLRAYFTFVSKAMFDPALMAKLTASLTAAKEQVAAALAPHMADPSRARELADIVMTQLDGAIMHLLLLGNEADLKAMWARMTSLLTGEYGDENRN